MKFTELLTPQTLRQGMISSSKKRVFESIARIVEEQLPMENGEQYCFDCLFNREKLGNSGLGGGVAMPKGRLPQGTKPIGVFIQLETPIEYDAADKPTRLLAEDVQQKIRMNWKRNVVWPM